MKNWNYILFWCILFYGCCSSNDSSSKKASFECKDDFWVSGKFYQSNKQDSLFLRLIDSKTGNCIPAVLDSNDWDKNLDLLIKRDSKLILKGHNEVIELSDFEQAVGLSLLENLDDLDGDGLDDIGLVWYAEDFSSLSRYHVYSTFNGKIREWFQFPIHEGMLDDGNEFIKVSNDSIYCREYHPELDNLIDDGSEWFSHSRKKINI